jgi:hypothetical protein
MHLFSSVGLRRQQAISSLGQLVMKRDHLMYELRFLVLMLLTLVVAAGCATVPAVPNVESVDSSGIGIEVWLNFPHGFSKRGASVVYFTRFGADQEGREETVYASNYQKDGRVYLLNVPPGDYVAVAAALVAHGSKPLTDLSNLPKDIQFVYFPQELVNQTRVLVDKGQFAYAGSYVIDASYGICAGVADDIQIHYAERFEPGTSKCGIKQLLGQTSRMVLKGNFVIVGGHIFSTADVLTHYRGSIHDANWDEHNKIEFFRKAQGDLAEGGWRILNK